MLFNCVGQYAAGRPESVANVTADGPKFWKILGVKQVMVQPSHREVIDQLGTPMLVPRHPRRVVSLVPSQTELLFALGVGSRVVGRTRFCVHPADRVADVPIVGGTKNPRLKKIAQLQPDLVIANCEENERELAHTLRRQVPVWVSDVRDLASALQMIRSLGELLDVAQPAARIAAEIANGFAGLRPDVGTRVAYLIWDHPLMVAGGGTFIDAMLKQCGLVNVFAERPRYPVISEQELASCNCQLLLSSEPYRFKASDLEVFANRFPGCTPRLVDGEYFSWYGSRMLQAVACFQELIAALGSTAEG